MKAVVFEDVGTITLKDVAPPKLQEPTDAIVRITTSAICGTDLHMVRGTLPGMKPGTILGHEGVGVIEELGADVRNFSIGDRVVIPSTIACGNCSYCRGGFYSQCDHANPHGKRAGTAFFGGPETTGPYQGLQAERARIPFAHVGLVKLPDEVSDEQAIMLSDIFPTAWFGVEMAAVHPGASVAVFGCGPVGQFVIASLKLVGAGRIFAVDCVPARLQMARAQGAEVINFDEEDPVEALLRLTHQIGPDRVIDAVGVDAMHPHHGPAAANVDLEANRRELETIAPQRPKEGDTWQPGDAPNQALDWAVQAVAKWGTLSVIGVYPQTDRTFPIGRAMNKNLTLRMGNCPHRKYIPHLVELVRTGAIDPSQILTQAESLSDAIEAFTSFDQRQAGWVKVALRP